MYNTRTVINKLKSNLAIVAFIVRVAFHQICIFCQIYVHLQYLYKRLCINLTSSIGINPFLTQYLKWLIAKPYFLGSIWQDPCRESPQILSAQSYEYQWL